MEVRFFLSLLYGTPAPSAEHQHPEAWSASTDGHLRGVSLQIVPANKVFLPEKFRQITFFLTNFLKS